MTDFLSHEMLRDMESAPEAHQPTNFWSKLFPSIVTEVEEFGLLNFRRHHSALNFYVPAYAGDGGSQQLANYDYLTFRRFDNPCNRPKLDSVCESQVGNPLQQFEFSGNLYSRSFLNYLRGLVYLKSLVDTDTITSVLEIGGGYGTLGEIFLKSDFDRYFYVNVDIPPLAYISTRYLEEVFGKENVAGYDVTKEMDVIDVAEMSKRYKAMVLCSWQLPRLQGVFDLFVNYISFQEMEPDVVENYAKHVNRLVKNYILLRNQRYGKQVANKVGDFGVLEPVTREHYLKFFSGFDLVGVDSKTFGEEKGGFASEVMVLNRQDKY
ncbi:MAG: putative sugar O-methyltransferase [Pseudomonadota bacterium]|nr:putative sugar O-methyltransferase [Pseudomonadota bacterium]